MATEADQCEENITLLRFPRDVKNTLIAASAFRRGKDDFLSLRYLLTARSASSIVSMFSDLRSYKCFLPVARSTIIRGPR